MLTNYRVVRIRVTPAERIALLPLLFELGFKWHGETGRTPEEIEERWSSLTYPYLEIQFKEKYLQGNRYSEIGRIPIWSYNQTLRFVRYHNETHK